MSLGGYPMEIVLLVMEDVDTVAPLEMNFISFLQS